MLERVFRYFTAKLVLAGGLCIVVQAFFLPHSEGFIAWVRLLQKALPLLVALDILIGVGQRVLGGRWPWRRWAWLLLAIAPLYPFAISPYGVSFAGNSYVFWAGLCLIPLALREIGPFRQVERGAIAVACITVLMVLWVTEWVLRHQPDAPYTYSELSVGQPFKPRRMDSDSGFYAPFRLQRFRRNWTDSLRTLKKLEFHQIYTYNNWGFNDTDWPESSSDSTEIWIALGDSFTEGVGAGPKGESNWPRLLQTRIRKEKPQVRILNAGMSGADPVLSLRVVERLIPRYHPKIVLLAINVSDVDDIAERGGLDRVYQPLHITPFEYGMMTSFIFRQLFIKLLKYNYYGDSPKKQLSNQQKAFQTLQQLSKRLEEMGRKANFYMRIYYIPSYVEMQDSAQQPHPLGQLSGITSLWECYLQKGVQGQANQYYWPIDRHHTPAGYAVMAECIYESLPDSLKQAPPQLR